jgi:multidrug resistance efflux pump
MAPTLLLTDPALAGRLLWAALPLVGALLGGAIVLYLIDRWRKRGAAEEEAAATPNDQLSRFRSLYERGEMSREEFERVKALLTGQLRRELNVPAPAAPAESRPVDTNIQAAPPDPQSPPPPEAPPT